MSAFETIFVNFYELLKGILQRVVIMEIKWKIPPPAHKVVTTLLCSKTKTYGVHIAILAEGMGRKGLLIRGGSTGKKDHWSG